MPNMEVNRSIFIKKPVSTVYEQLNDFNHWSSWSPWLIMEPNVELEVSDDGKYYKWKGEIVGSGEMKVTAEKENVWIDYDLTFFTPYKSMAKVGFKLKEEEGGTLVTWTMSSKLPFFMFWMKRKMESFIGMDYERGLGMLKDYLEDGKVHSELSFKGKNTFDQTKYIGIPRETAITEIEKDMTSDYQKLMQYVKSAHPEDHDKAFSIYHKWDPVNNTVSYTAAVAVPEHPKKLPSGMVIGELPNIQVHTVHHKGPYRHIGNAWAAQQMWMRGKKFKMDKRFDPIEVYLNRPEDTPEKELESEIHFACK